MSRVVVTGKANKNGVVITAERPNADGTWSAEIQCGKEAVKIRYMTTEDRQRPVDVFNERGGWLWDRPKKRAGFHNKADAELFEWLFPDWTAIVDFEDMEPSEPTGPVPLAWTDEEIDALIQRQIDDTLASQQHGTGRL